jgi:L-ascorbate metabolism protein UlaG (beta-lactamase superfamily)
MVCQAGFKLPTPGGKIIMIDPWINCATRLPDVFKDLSKLGKVDLILATHGHGDHLGDAMELAKTNDMPNALPGRSPSRRRTENVQGSTLNDRA